MTIPKLELVLRDASIKPAVNEMELHPHFQQPQLLGFVMGHGIVPIGYSPFGSPSRPERDRTPDDTVDMVDTVVIEIAARTGLTPAAVCIKWGLQRGYVVIPFSVKRKQYLDSLRAAVSAPLGETDMAELATIDKNCRLVKGQVFLWRDGQSWEDLWDLDGRITE
jgi:alcohol dehydrogenase (NADP+)